MPKSWLCTSNQESNHWMSTVHICSEYSHDLKGIFNDINSLKKNYWILKKEKKRRKKNPFRNLADKPRGVLIALLNQFCDDGRAVDIPDCISVETKTLNILLFYFYFGKV